MEKIREENSGNSEVKTEDDAIMQDKNNVEKAEIEEISKLEDDDSKKIGNSMLHKYTIVITVVSIILLIGALVFSTVFALINKNNNKIISGISIKGIDVSKLTCEEAKTKINEILQEKLNQNIVLKHGEFETSLIAEQIEAKFGVDEAVDLAYKIGRNGNILKDNYTIINTMMNNIDITPSFTYNEKALTDFIQSTSENLPDKVQQSNYYVEKNNLIINKGKKGSVIEVEELKNSVVQNFKNLDSASVIDIPIEEKEPDAVDIEKIHAEIYKAPQDAYYTQNPFTVYPHVNGIDFKISNEEVQNLLNNQEEQITIPLKVTTPKVTTNQIGTEAFPNLLASFSTTFSTKNTNRATNIRLASNKINGVVLLPGEKFSYNTVVGKRTAQAGYKTASVYVGGKVEEGIGGGICQVSSTLYNTVLRANLEIVARSNHRFATGYVPLSTDATVSWGGPEFIFKNSRKYPIKIVSSVSGGRIKVDIYGCKEEVEYDVTIQSETLSTIPMQTEYRTNTSLPKGTKKTVQNGHGGYKSRAYRILKLNGKVVSKQLLSTDTYAQLPTIIEQNM